MRHSPDRRTADDVRVAVDRALARALPAGADPWEAPRELAVHVALSEGLSAEDALARCGVRLGSGRPRPARVPFVRLPAGALFWVGPVRYRKVGRTARTAALDAPNAVAVDDPGRVLWVAPDQRVEPVPTAAR